MTEQDETPIVVAGDVVIDWLAWPVPPTAASPAANWRQREGTRMVARRGGALLLTDLLRAATARKVVGQRVDDIAARPPHETLHALIDVVPVGNGFRVVRLRGSCGPAEGEPPPAPLEQPTPTAKVLVLDDAGNAFRHAPASWHDLLASRPDWLVLKMARPLASGPLWEQVRHGPINGPDGADPRHLVVVIDAEDLRAEGIAIGRRLSWERTAEDFAQQLASNGRLDTLVTCAHLIVRFGCDSVIHHRGRSGERPDLYFDPDFAEGEFAESWGGPMEGAGAAFVAGLTAALADDAVQGMDDGIRRGMAAARRLARAGFIADAQGQPDYPVREAVAPGSDERVARVSIPLGRIAAGAAWSILDDVLGDPAAAARQVVSEGPDIALARVPIARFGALTTADRRETESLRAVGILLREYLATPQAKPISIAVFGPPGAGKSFGVVQVAS